MRNYFIVSSEKYPDEPVIGVPTRYQATLANVRYFEREGTIREVSEEQFRAEGFDPKEFTYFQYEGPIRLVEQEGGYAVSCLQMGSDPFSGRYLEKEFERMGVPDSYDAGAVRARITIELFFD